jgi:hypothetical protein
MRTNETPAEMFDGLQNRKAIAKATGIITMSTITAGSTNG